MDKILIIQPAFLGDLILATALIEKLKAYYPSAQIDLLIRKGQGRILKGHPHIHQLLELDRSNKWRSIRQLLAHIRPQNYDLVINCHRHFTAGLLATLSKGKKVVGFKKNPFSWAFSQAEEHIWAEQEVYRNHRLIAAFTDKEAAMPKLYPAAEDWGFVAENYGQKPYITISPASLWETKRLPLSVWAELLQQLPKSLYVYVLGGPADREHAQALVQLAKRPNLYNLAGQHSFLQDVALMKGAKLNYVLDSAPLHICSAIDAPVAAVFCSTSPTYGFGPLSKTQFIIHQQPAPACWPCGSHGYTACPKAHFNCGQIAVMPLLAPLKQLAHELF